MKKVIFSIFFGLVLVSAIMGYVLLNNKGNDPEIENQITEVNNGGANMVSNNTEEGKLYIKINGRMLMATLEDNSSAAALMEKLAQSDITIDMHDYGDFEKVGPLGFDLPRNDEQITTTPGDIILYQGNSVTIYYDTNSWNFTKLGHIDDMEQGELKKILGDGNVTVTFSLGE